MGTKTAKPALLALSLSALCLPAHAETHYARVGDVYGTFCSSFLGVARSCKKERVDAIGASVETISTLAFRYDSVDEYEAPDFPGDPGECTGRFYKGHLAPVFWQLKDGADPQGQESWKSLGQPDYLTFPCRKIER